MEIRKIRKLIDLLQSSDVSEIEIKEGEESVRLSRLQHQNGSPQQQVAPQQFIPNQQQAPDGAGSTVVQDPAQPQPPTQAPNTEKPQSENNTQQQPQGHEVRSPMVGTVYLSPSPDENSFVQVGQRVSAGDTLCLVEAMKMFNPIEADRAGIINACLVDNASPIEYDQPLFIISEEE